SHSHGLSTALLDMQSQSLGVPLLQRRAAWEEYEAEFKKALLVLREKGITEGVFGDIDLDEHRQWVERVCCECGVTPHLPLWGDSQDSLLRDFINAGFKAVVVVTRADVLNEEWLGREVNVGFLADLTSCKNVTPCGEAGEYHSLVIDGPLFTKGIMITEAEKVLRDDYWFLDIKKADFS
ncbi:diphthine--ammonia ligase, partial [Chloroflexota bacterium]